MTMRTTDDEDETHFISTPFWDSSPSAKFGDRRLFSLHPSEDIERERGSSLHHCINPTNWFQAEMLDLTESN